MMVTHVAVCQGFVNGQGLAGKARLGEAPPGCVELAHQGAGAEQGTRPSLASALHWGNPYHTIL